MCHVRAMGGRYGFFTGALALTVCFAAPAWALDSNYTARAVPDAHGVFGEVQSVAFTLTYVGAAPVYRQVALRNTGVHGVSQLCGGMYLQGHTGAQVGCTLMKSDIYKLHAGINHLVFVTTSQPATELAEVFYTVKRRSVTLQAALANGGTRTEVQKDFDIHVSIQDGYWVGSYSATKADWVDIRMHYDTPRGRAFLCRYKGRIAVPSSGIVDAVMVRVGPCRLPSARDYTLHVSYTGEKNPYIRNVYNTDAAQRFDITGVATLPRSAQLAVPTAVPSHPTAGGAVTFASHMSGRWGAGAVVAFRSGPDALCEAPVGTDGLVRCSVTGIAAGKYAVKAVYDGDSASGGVTSGPLSLAVSRTRIHTLTAPQLSPAPAEVGAPVVYLTTVAGGRQAFRDVTGSIYFRDGTTNLCKADMPNGGIGTVRCVGKHTIASNALVAGFFQNKGFQGTGKRSVTAFYEGDALYASATSAATAVTVTQRATRLTSLGMKPKAPGVGANVTLHGALRWDGIAGVNETGTAVFQEGDVTLCTAAVKIRALHREAGFSCMYRGGFASRGRHDIAIAFTGGPGSRFANAVSTGTSIEVSDDIPVPAAATSTPTLALTSSPENTAAVGAEVTYTAVVAEGNNPPDVVIEDNNVAVDANNCAKTDTSTAGYTYTCTVTYAAVSTHTVVASLGANANNEAPADVTVMFSVEKASPTLALTSNPVGTAGVGAAVTYRAVVANGYNPEDVVIKDNGVTVDASDCKKSATSVSGHTYTCTTTHTTAGRRTVVASLGANANNKAATDATVTLQVQAVPTLALASSPKGTAAVGAEVTYTAVVAEGHNPPDVVIEDNGGTLSNCQKSSTSVSGYIYTCTITYTTLSTRTVVASLGANANNEAPADVTVMFSVEKASPTLALTSNLVGGTASLGQSVTYTAAVANGYNPPTVAIKDNNVAVDAAHCIKSATSVSGYIYTCTITHTTAGRRTVVASLLGNTNNEKPTDATVMFSVEKASPTLALTSNLVGGTASLGQSVTYTAAVANGYNPPTVAIKDNNVAVDAAHCIKSATSVSGYIYTCTITHTTAGTHSVVASLLGNTNNEKPTDATVRFSVEKASPTLALTSNPQNTAVVGAAVTVTYRAVVADGYNPADVAIKDNNAALSGCQKTNITTAGYTYTCTVTYAAVSTHSVVASLGANANNEAATDATVRFSVEKASPTLALTSNPQNTAVVGAAVTVTYRAVVADGYNPADVAIKDNNAALSGCQKTNITTAGYTYTCTVTYAAVSTHSVVASLGANANNEAATDATVRFSVEKASPTLALTSNLVGGTAGLGQSVTYTAEVANGYNPEDVVIKDNGVTVDASKCQKSATSVSGYTYTCTTTHTTAGRRTVVASLGANANNEEATDATVTLQVQAVPTLTLRSNPVGTAGVGAEVTYTAVVAGGNNPADVVITDDGGTLSNCQKSQTSPAGYTYTCTVTYAVAGARTVVASLGANANNEAPADVTVTLQVEKASPTLTLESSPKGTAAIGAEVTYTAVVAGGYNPQDVEIKDNGTSVAGCQKSQTSTRGYTSTCTVTYAMAGRHSVVARLAGDANNRAPAHAIVSLDVSGTQSTLSLTLPTLQPNGSGAIVATVTGFKLQGTVAFSATQQSGTMAPLMLCMPSTVTLEGEENSKTASCMVTAPGTGGSYSVFAHYSGDSANSIASTTETLTVPGGMDDGDMDDGDMDDGDMGDGDMGDGDMDDGGMDDGGMADGGMSNGGMTNGGMTNGGGEEGATGGCGCTTAVDVSLLALGTLLGLLRRRRMVRRV